MTPIEVDIFVDDDVQNNICKIQVDPDPIHLAGQGASKAPEIQWKVRSTSGTWRFGPTGIEVKQHGKTFEDATVAGSPSRKWKRKENRADGNTYKYSIALTNGQMTLVIDPTIINQP